MDKSHLLGTTSEIYYNGNVFIINLTEQLIKVGQNIILEREGEYIVTTIEEIKLDEESVQEISTGEVGLKISGKAKINDKIWC